MAIDVRNFLYSVKNLPIDKEKLKPLLTYLSGNLFKYVYFYNEEDLKDFFYLIEDFDYDYLDLDKFLQLAYNVKNVSLYNSQNNRLVTMSEVNNLYNLLVGIRFDFGNYDSNDDFINRQFIRTIIYRVSKDELMLNDEISLYDFTKSMYNAYPSDPANKNLVLVRILKLADMIDRGLKESQISNPKVFTSEEIKTLFENIYMLDRVNLYSIVKDFYPVFGNRLFSLVMEGISLNDSSLLNNYLLNMQELEMDKGETRKEIITGLSLNENVTLSKMNEVVNNLITQLDNSSLSKNSIEVITSNINEVFARYKDLQEENITDKVNSFFNNCDLFVNEVLLSSKENREDLELLVTHCIKDCKDFFLEYDARKFKEIFNCIKDNTSIDGEALIEVNDKCKELFKKGSIEKIKIVNKTLNDFKEYLKNTYNNELLNNNMLDLLLNNNPNILMNSDSFNEVVEFLKGNISLKDKGYTEYEFKIGKNILSYDFFNKIINENPKALFNSSLEKFSNNLKYLEDVMHGCGMKIRDLKINEEMIYNLLSGDFDENQNYSFMSLSKIFTTDDLIRIIESNPALLNISRKELGYIYERVALNSNDNYDFYGLLSSELYFYNHENYLGKSKEEILNLDFKYINLNIPKNENLDFFEILDHGEGLVENIDEILEAYERRNNDIEKLNNDIANLPLEQDVNALVANIQNIFSLYNNIYGKVPQASTKDKIIDAISEKKNALALEIMDKEDELKSQKEYLEIYGVEIKDGMNTKKALEELLPTITTEGIAQDIRLFLKKLEENRIAVSMKKEKENREAIAKLDECIAKLKSMSGSIDASLLLASNVLNTNNIDRIEEEKPYFTIATLNIDVKTLKSVLDGKNVLVFEQNFDLSSIPNDVNFYEKINKFIGDGPFSITNNEFTSMATNNLIEKYNEPRGKIYSRREDATPVRIYFIPVKNAYFTCYYVIGVNYKDDRHLDGGCSDEKVYKKRVAAAKKLEEKIASFDSEEELIDFVKEAREKYKELMQPILIKVNKNKVKK